MDENKAVNTPINKDGFWKEFFKFLFLAIVIVVPIRLFIIQPFVVSGASMDPTFKDGDYLIIDELSYRFGDPERGDVIVFRYPGNPKQFYIKRIIGLPGESVDVVNDIVTIKSSTGEIKLSEPYVEYPGGRDAHLELNQNQFFVMGDNRIASSDSRIWGAVDRTYLIGKALVRLFPLTKISYAPGDYIYNEI